MLSFAKFKELGHLNFTASSIGKYYSDGWNKNQNFARFYSFIVLMKRQLLFDFGQELEDHVLQTISSPKIQTRNQRFSECANESRRSRRKLSP